MPARVDRLRVLKLVIVEELRLGRLAWHSLFTQMRLCHIVLRRTAIITPTVPPITLPPLPGIGGGGGNDRGGSPPVLPLPKLSARTSDPQAQTRLLDYLLKP